MRDDLSDRSYDPFAQGSYPVGMRTFAARDLVRGRRFPCDIWYPARIDAAGAGAGGQDPGPGPASPGPHPLIVFSHYSGGHRRSATYLCSHLASHGYVVAAMDHSEVVAPELAGREGETDAERAARIDAVISSRVPDVRFLLDFLLDGAAGTSATGAGAADAAVADAAVADGRPADAAVTDAAVTDAGTAGGEGSVTGDIGLDPARIGLVGHSFGGWTVLAVPEADSRAGAVVALGPGGNSNPRPGILPLTLTFEWGRDVPTLYLAAADDTPIPLAGVRELFDRTAASKRMFVLCRADHQHFLDDVEGEHEAVRAMSFPGAAAWIPAAMRPITELSSGDQAHLFVRGTTLAHLDATLRRSGAAERFLAGDVPAALAARGVEAAAYQP